LVRPLYLYWNKEIPTASKHVSIARESLPTPSDELSDERKVMANFYMPLLEGILLFRLGEAKGAADKLRETLARAPSGARADVAELYFYLGKSLLEVNEGEKARGALAKVTELDPNGPYASDAKRSLTAKK
jgi:tetratricopeptide (TPR) repeat protein